MVVGTSIVTPGTRQMQACDRVQMLASELEESTNVLRRYSHCYRISLESSANTRDAHPRAALGPKSTLTKESAFLSTTLNSAPIVMQPH